MSNSNQTPPELDSRFCLNYFEQVVKFYKEELRQENPIKAKDIKKCKSLIASQSYVSLSINEGAENNQVVLDLLADSPSLIFLLKNPTDDMICKSKFAELEQILCFIPVEKLSWRIVSYYLSCVALSELPVKFCDLHAGIINYFKLKEIPQDYELPILRHFEKIKFDSKPNRISKKFGKHPVYGHLKFSDNFWKNLIKKKSHQKGLIDLLKVNYTPVLKQGLMEACPQLAMQQFAEQLSVDDYICIFERAKNQSQQFQQVLVRLTPFIPYSGFNEALDQLYKRKTILETL